MSEIIRQNHSKVNLRDYSKKDKIWDKHKAKADVVAKLYDRFGDSPRDRKRASKVRDCAGTLRFGRDEFGVFHLLEARYCKNYKLCPVCQWRRSLMLKAKFYTNLPEIIRQNPTVRFISLTLTVKNPLLSDLRATLKLMNKAFNNMMKLERMKNVIGYVRNVEVTKPEDEMYCHPHFHILLAVKSTYFKADNYITQAEYRSLWRDSLKVDYLPDVHVSIVRGDINKYVNEVLKYAVKENDIDKNSTWFIKYVEQVHRLRFISTSGILKGVVKEAENDTDDELIKMTDTNGEKAVEILDFKWNRPVKKYQRIK